MKEMPRSVTAGGAVSTPPRSASGGGSSRGTGPSAGGGGGRGGGGLGPGSAMKRAASARLSTSTPAAAAAAARAATLSPDAVMMTKAMRRRMEGAKLEGVAEGGAAGSGATSEEERRSSSGHLDSTPKTRNGDVGPGAGGESDSSAAASAPSASPSSGPSLVSALSYRGMEVVFATAPGPDASTSPLVAVFSRTRSPFQTLDLPPSSLASGVVALASHPVTGLVCVATADGKVHTYYPVECLPAPVKDDADGGGTNSAMGNRIGMAELGLGTPSGIGEKKDAGAELPRPVSAFGRYRWVNGRVIECGDVFASASLNDEGQMFERRTPMGSGTTDEEDEGFVLTTGGGGGGPVRRHVCLSSSMDHKVLVGHADQLAVFDARPPPADAHTPDPATGSLTPPRADLLWTARTHAAVLHCTLAGDGRSIAYVLEGEGEGVPYPYGARTYVRDREDGSYPPPPPPPRGLSTTPHAPAAPLMDRNTEATPRGVGKPGLAVDAKALGRSLPLPPHTSPAALSGLSGGGLVSSGVGLQHRALPTDGSLGCAGAGGDRTLQRQNSRSNLLKSPMAIEQPPVPGGAAQHDDGQRNTSLGSTSTGGPLGSGAVGIVYKPGPFLVHSAPVTRLTFRGLGLDHSTLFPHHPDFALDEDEGVEEGNDLLLTTCESDGSCRVFSQNSWRQLLHWTTPPGSRADWVEGVASANLGDLYPPPKNKKKSGGGGGGGSRGGSAPSSRRGSAAGGASVGGPGAPASSPAMSVPASDASDASGGINRHLLMGQPQPSMPAHPTPSSSAGAWISELTFRGPFPALRLSRLSYLKSGGDDAAPAHFESVAAVLPPGTIRDGAVLGRVVGPTLRAKNVGQDSDDEGKGNAKGKGKGKGGQMVFGCGDEGSAMSVQGVWPAWDPWDHSGSGAHHDHDDNLEESALTLLGSAGGIGALSSALGAGLGGGGALGGSHGPPSELRIVASHTGTGEVVIMEFPLWGDKDFGAMELGSPLRYLLSLSEGGHHRAIVPAGKKSAMAAGAKSAGLGGGRITASANFECSSRLTAAVSNDGRSVYLLWRKAGTMNILPAKEEKDLEHDDDHDDGFDALRRMPSMESVASTLSVDSDLSHFSYDFVPEFGCGNGAAAIVGGAIPPIGTRGRSLATIGGPGGRGGGPRRRFVDLSALPLPLKLPSLRLPPGASPDPSVPDSIASILWWRDENFGGPPRLVALTHSGALLCYEMPPPWSALEPPMPSYDPFAAGESECGGSMQSSTYAGSSNVGGSNVCPDARRYSGLGAGVKESVGLDVSAHSHLLLQELHRVRSEESNMSGEGEEGEYEVSVTPHPDFGLGLRLEAQAEGMPAVAGSYKKHPLSGGRLPAERTNMIVLGDELLAVNGIGLEGITFDEIIASVRRAGADARGGPLVMKFRRSPRRRLGSAYESAAAHSAAHSAAQEEKEKGRALYRSESTRSSGESAHQRGAAAGSRSGTAEDGGSVAHTVLVGAMEFQQEFGRIVAYVRDAFPPPKEEDAAKGKKKKKESATPPLEKLVLLPVKGTHDEAILVAAQGSSVSAYRLVIPGGGMGDPEDAEFVRLGSVDISSGDEDLTTATDADGDGESSTSAAEVCSVEVVSASASAGNGGWCLTASDSDGGVSFVFLTLPDEEEPSSDDEEGGASKPSATLRAVRALRGNEATTGAGAAGLSSAGPAAGEGDNKCIKKVVRAASVELLATMPLGGVAKAVTVWSAMPLPSRPALMMGGGGGGKANAQSDIVADYAPTVVTHNGMPGDDDGIGIGGTDVGEPILDFRWVASGSLDAFPWLVTFSSDSAVLHRRPGGSDSWIPTAEVSYPSLSGSSDPLLRPSKGRSGNRRVFSGAGICTATGGGGGGISPADAMPHVLPALRSAAAAATDERSYVRSDWHPDSILAYVCTEERGVKTALRRNVKGVYRWLSRWTSPDAASRPSWNAASPLAIAPLRAVRADDGGTEAEAEAEEEDDEQQEEEKPVESATALMSMFALGGAKKAEKSKAAAAADDDKPKKPKSEDEILLSKLQEVLNPSAAKGKNDKDKNGSDHGKSKSREFLLAMGAGKSGDSKGDDSLPDPIRKLNGDELRFLWAMGEVLRKPPKFKKLDSPAQLTVFSVSLMRNIEKAEDDDGSCAKDAGFPPSPISSNVPRRTILVKQSSSRNMDNGQTSRGPPTMASSACLAALLSDTQSALLESCRRPGSDKMDWPTARALRLPFWVRSDGLLRKMAEEIGSEIFKRTKDVMRCALYFVAMRNMKKLRALAATDRNESGKKFFKFVTDHDFRGQRGRKAAEKNAYSLLRKRKYDVATAFFLLAEPPMLKTALEVIVSQMEDLSLAFLVARLIEGNTSDASAGGPSSGLTIGGGFGGGGGLSLGMMGGGGGFASGGGIGGPPMPGADDAADDAVPFKDWTPDIGQGTRNLLTLRGLFLVEDDPTFEAVQRLWLGQPEEAALAVAGRRVASSSSAAAFEGPADVSVPDVFDAPPTKQPQPPTPRGGTTFSSGPSPGGGSGNGESANDRVIAKSNNLIDFASAPLLLKAMGANKRVRWTSSLLVSRALCRKGIELPSARTMLQATDLVDLEDDNWEEEGKEGDAKQVPAQGTASPAVPSSSIFDSFDAPKPATAAAPSPGNATSSIFDSFDAAPSKPRPKPSTQNAAPNGEMSSSIFDSFGAAPQAKPKPKPAATQVPASGGMSSSIFDSFDAAPQKPKPKPAAAAAPASGEMSSSIFDSFDAAPPTKPKPKPAPAAAPASGEMSSSIFDSFGAAPQRPKPKPKPAATPPAPASGEMSSSIFDSFDAAPQKPKPKPKPTQPAPSSGEMSSSIFDSFDAAPQKPKPKPKPPVQASPSGTMSSSIFDSFDAPRPKPVGLTGGSVTSSHTEEKKEEKKEADEEEQKKSEEEEEEKVPPLRIPLLWAEWRQSVLVTSTARRFLRELARIISRFEGDALCPPMALFRRHVHPLVPSGAGHVLQYHCQGDAVMSSAEKKLRDLCADGGGLDAGTVVREALLALADPALQPRRIVFTVLLHCLAGRPDLAEDVVRDAAQEQLSHCESFAFSFDDLAERRRTRFHASSQYIRRQVTVVSWQLELCLWLQRGGTFIMSGLAAKEATAAVRIGLIVASWGRNHETFEKLLRCEPDCSMDHEVGRQLWSSMKMITGYHDKTVKGVGPSSGGWEFLVDCRRDEATAMLRDRKPGSFLIRPHADDHGVFTLSFRTNLVPNVDASSKADEAPAPPSDSQANANGAPPSGNGQSSGPGPSTPVPAKTQADAKGGTQARPVKRDDVVQHAIVRLSDAGFRCGSFGPFTSLMKLLEAISNSLPFSLLFNEPPVQGIIKEQGTSPSPNSFFLRKLSLHSKSNHFKWNTETQARARTESDNLGETEVVQTDDDICEADGAEKESCAQRRFGMFSQLLALSEVRKQVSAIAAAEFDESPIGESSSWQDPASQDRADVVSQDNIGDIDDFDGSLSGSEEELGEEEMYAVASRMLRPLLGWCRAMEVAIVHDIAPTLAYVSQGLATMPVDVAASETAIEIAPSDIGSCIDGGDALIRHMIQPGSGVEFRTLRLGEGGQSAIVVLFSKKEAITWLISTGAEKDETDAVARLRIMEKRRVIEQIDVNELAVGKSYTSDNKGAERDIRYRFVDPWEVEVVESKEGEVAGASLGRGHYLSFNVGIVARSCEQVQRSLGGLHLLGLWSLGKGGLFLTKALASVHPPWERAAGGDLQMKGGAVAEPPPYTNSMRQHLYRNILFRRLQAPQRFMALIQVELLDLKNLTSPSGTHTLTAYALLRLKRPGSGAPLTHKARTLDSAATQPKKISKISGPNAPASWGSLVRFRFPLPEDVNCDGVSFDGDKEALFKGAPSVLQISVYEKKFMSDSTLGGADVKLDALSSGGQLEEWVPLRAPHEKGGITWFARIRLTLRFELMCLETDEAEVEASMNSDRCPSVGLRRIKQLSRLGGAHEDTKQGMKKSVSTPDLITYLESMVY